MIAEWNIKALGDICEIAAGQGAPQGEENYCSSGTPFIKAGNLVDLTNGLPENAIQQVSEDVAKKWKLVKYPSGAVVFAKSGMSCMKGHIYTLQQDCYVVSHLAILIPKSVISPFLNYALKVFQPCSLAKDASFPSITLKDLALFQIPCPSLTEQRRIVNLLDKELDRIDRLKEKTETSLSEISKLYQSMVSGLFQKRKDGIVKNLGDICEFKNGLNFGREKGEQQYHFLGVGDFKDKTLIPTSSLDYIFQDGISEEYFLRDNDIVFVRSNGSRKLVGRSVLVKNDSSNLPTVFSGFCIRCRLCSNIVLPEYLLLFLSMEETKKTLTNSGGGCNISNLNQKTLSSLSIPIPSIEEQAKIVSYAALISGKITTIQDKHIATLALCDDLKQALLRKAFNGEL